MEHAPANDPGVFALFYVGVGIVLVWRIRSAKLDVTRLLGPTPTKDVIQLALVAPVLFVLSLAGFWALFLPLSYLAPEFVRKWAFGSATTISPDSLPMWVGHFIVSVVLAPAIEETFFRGLLLQRWAQKYGTLSAVVASSALFAVGHVELLGHFVFGVVMCALYLRTRSLLVPMAAHALNNFLAMILVLPAAISPDSAPKDMTLESFQAHWWLGIVIAAVGLAMLETYRRWYWPGIDVPALLRGPVPYSVVEPVTTT